MRHTNTDDIRTEALRESLHDGNHEVKFEILGSSGPSRLQQRRPLLATNSQRQLDYRPKAYNTPKEVATPSHFGKKSLDLYGNCDFGAHQTYSGNNKDVQDLIDQDQNDLIMENEEQDQRIVDKEYIGEEQEL